MEWLIGFVAGAVITYVLVTFNRLTGRRNRVRNGWSQVETQLQRRADLIPRMVEAVSGYMRHERRTLERVTMLRSRALEAGPGPEPRAQAEKELTLAARDLFAAVESYPELRASENVASLQEELASTENRIAFARQFYNDSVLEQNNLVQSFPAILVARPFGFGTSALFALEDDAIRSAPPVEL